MKQEHIVRLLEASLGVCAAVLLGGLGVLAFSGLSGMRVRGKRHSEAPPDPGSVSSERQHPVASASPR